ncbi:MAG: hypothetical protein OXM54_16470 [Acidimicrobiaceae bacterium]|nr:hypothetical protein [Acidimicrobiaceae bacterium]
MPADQADQADRDGAVAELSRLLNSVDTETADAVTAREASLYAFLSLGSPAEAVRKEAEEFLSLRLFWGLGCCVNRSAREF